MTYLQRSIAETLSRAWQARRLWRCLGISIAFLAVVDITFLAVAGPMLTVRDPVTKADIIVVLGGDGPPRAARGAQLWLAGVAPRILVSGGGDCQSIRRAMIRKGVDDRAITVECNSHSTWQNAAFSAPVLLGIDVRKAVLVTSWFHSRRAIACFSATYQNIRWSSVPARPRPIIWMFFFDQEGYAVLVENLKTIWYGLTSPCVPIGATRGGPLPAQPARP